MARILARKRVFRTRKAILGLLKELGPRHAESLANRLGVSAMAIRQHLYALHAEKLVVYEEQARPVGRPAKLWQLTPAADRFFPNGHAELAVGLLSALGDALGPPGLEKVLAARARQQVVAYRRRVPSRGPLQRRLAALAQIRTEEGYMAEVEPLDGGGFALIENHCPICAAASACTGLCHSEIEVFRAVLGSRVSIERTEHIVSGARRCVYRVREDASLGRRRPR